MSEVGARTNVGQDMCACTWCRPTESQLDVRRGILEQLQHLLQRQNNIRIYFHTHESVVSTENQHVVIQLLKVYHIRGG